MNAGNVADWWQALLTSHDDRVAAIDDAYQQVVNAGLLNRVVVRRYICRKRGCVLAVVVRLGDDILIRTRDYKLSPGMNLDKSAESARRKNTLDGDNHWPGHTFDVRAHGGGGASARVDMICRHGLRTVSAADILEAVDGVQPGHPKAPLRI